MLMVKRVFSTIVVLALALAVSPAFAQTPPPQEQVPAPREQPQAPSRIDGELLSVDVDAKTLTIKPAQGDKVELRYNDQTEVSGGETGLAGLAANTGTQVSVRFTGEGKDRLATHIEIRPKK